MTNNYTILSNQQVWLYSAKYGNMWWCYDCNTSKKLTDIYNDYKKRNNTLTNTSPYKVADPSFININTDQIPSKDLSFDFVSYDDTSNSVNSSDMIIKETNNSEKIIDYIITTNNNSFLIDFNNFQQINCVQHRKRKIKLIEIPDGVSDIKSYLQNNFKVKGVAGIQWL
jgi:hypothetical protein